MRRLNHREAYARRRKKLIFSACALRDTGLTYAEIGKRLGGFKRSTVWGWIHRPDRHSARGTA